MTTADGESRQEVLEVAADAGFPVSETQLARWHRFGLLPRPRQQALGRGLGTATVYPAGTAAQLVALCRIRSEIRSLDMIAFELWWEGFPITIDLIRPTIHEVARQLDDEIATGSASGEFEPKSPLEGLLSRRLGRQRIVDISNSVHAAAQDAPGPIQPIDEFDDFPASFDEMARVTVPFAGRLLAGVSAAQTVDEAVQADLVSARDKARNFLTFLAEWAPRLAWLFGGRGEVFRLLADIEQRLGPGDLPGMVLALLMMERSLPAQTLDFLSTPPPDPEIMRFLRTIGAIRDQIPGARDAFTPAAIRAVLRDKEASHRRHTPKIKHFVDENREHINRVLATIESPNAAPPPPRPLPRHPSSRVDSLSEQRDPAQEGGIVQLSERAQQSGRRKTRCQPANLRQCVERPNHEWARATVALERRRGENEIGDRRDADRHWLLSDKMIGLAHERLYDDSGHQTAKRGSGRPHQPLVVADAHGECVPRLAVFGG